MTCLGQKSVHFVFDDGTVKMQKVRALLDEEVVLN
jgi:hypothetical protein